ncbi:hypothetical protein LPN01_00545 [Sphingomonas sp. A2-49]|uniref:hypothetical protein n=1 Tax=Sphingomonas sp. A2-49 TaxID=1391375 RepID=UPI0021CEC0D9|nr:hypothetical protein [Sphingomonas sp. A2-49]MCU6452561.1 hypothetical protein [Sphingomonas sp. A2-49]
MAIQLRGSGSRNHAAMPPPNATGIQSTSWSRSDSRRHSMESRNLRATRGI